MNYTTAGKYPHVRVLISAVLSVWQFPGLEIHFVCLCGILMLSALAFKEARQCQCGDFVERSKLNIWGKFTAITERF